MVTSQLSIIRALNNQLIRRGNGNKAEYDVWYEGHYLGTIVKQGMTYLEYREDCWFKYHNPQMCLQSSLLGFVARAERCIGLPINVRIHEQGDILEFTYMMRDMLAKVIRQWK